MSLTPAIPNPSFGPYEEPTDSYALRILDAAYAEFVEFGLRRATLDTIAKRAGVGRMTLHRRFSSKQAVIEAVFARENARIVAGIAEIASAEDDVVDALTESLALGLESLWQSPLLGRLYDTDREAVVPSLTYEAGPLMSETTRYVLHRLSRARPPRIGAEIAAEATVRICHSVLLVGEGVENLRDPVALRNFLRPVIGALIG